MLYSVVLTCLWKLDWNQSFLQTSVEVSPVLWQTRSDSLSFLKIKAKRLLIPAKSEENEVVFPRKFKHVTPRKFVLTFKLTALENILYQSASKTVKIQSLQHDFSGLLKFPTRKHQTYYKVLPPHPIASLCQIKEHFKWRYAKTSLCSKTVIAVNCGYQFKYPVP